MEYFASELRADVAITYGRISLAGKHREPRVFREIRIGCRELAQNKDRTAIGTYRAGIAAVGTQPAFHTFRPIAHKTSITQTLARGAKTKRSRIWVGGSNSQRAYAVA